MSTRLLHGDCREVLKTLPSESVHCVVTSPPYFGLRDYGTAGQIGLEATPDAYVAEIVAVFREVRRVLRNDGTLWLNMGDSYVSAPPGNKGPPPDIDGVYKRRMERQLGHGENKSLIYAKATNSGLKPKDLIGIPWMVAFALRADGWYLRQDLIWSKPNPMPESVRDRCTKAHEYLFLLSKKPKYFYDAEAIAEPVSETPGAASWRRIFDPSKQAKEIAFRGGNDGDRGDPTAITRNRRSVWEVATQPFSEAHFATFPPALIEPCILAGCPAKACAKCGKPWVREVERSGEWRAQHDRQAKHNGDVYRTNPGGGIAGVNTSRLAIDKGFSPSCSCNAATVPGTCLDPFSGAGTTGLVADRLGRNAILIELNAGYADMSHRRIVDDLPLFAEVVAA